MLTAVVGVIFALSVSVLLGLAATAPAPGSVLRTSLLLGAILLLSSAATALFAGRSSLGALVTGLTALVAQSAAFMAPIHASSLPYPWLQKLISTGFVLILAALWLGGSWGDHLLSLPWVLAGLALAAFLLPRSYLRAVAPGIQTGPLMLGAVLVSVIALAAAGASTARSTLGARVTGPILILLAVPALSDDMIPGGHLISRLLPYGPDAVVLAAIGIELMAIGWGAHMARRQGRANALARLRSGA